MLRVVSAFSGIGGFDLAFERAGCQIVAQIENDPACQAVLRQHWPDVPLFGDVATVNGEDLPEFDILVGGFPCQDLSVAGGRAGLQGERSGLFFEFARLVKETRPTWWLLENVPGLLSSHRGRDMGTLLGTMGDLGYWWAYRSLDAQFFGVPQRRRRVFIVGHSRSRSGPRQVLLEPEGRQRHPPKSRTTRSAAPVTRALTESFGTGGADLAHAEAGWIGAYGRTVGTLQSHSESSGYRLGADEVAAGHVIPTHSIAPCLQEREHKGQDSSATRAMVIRVNEPQAYSVYPESGQGADLRACEAEVAPSLSATDGERVTDRGLRIVQAFPVAERGRDGDTSLEVGEEGTYNALRAGNGGSSRHQLVAYTTEEDKRLAAGGAVAFDWQASDGGNDESWSGKPRSWFVKKGDYAGALSVTKVQAVAYRPPQPKLHIVPLHLAQANDYVTEHHRHHKKTLSHKFSIGVATEDGELVGVAIVGRPVARRLDDGLTLEVNRTCTNGTPNANSCLYGAAWRVAREMGYHRLITYTQEGESGASLRGAGWSVVAQRSARGSWAHHSKQREGRTTEYGGVGRVLWEVSKDRPAVFRKATKAHHSADWERWEETDRADTIAAEGSTASATAVVHQDLAVRRLTPLECERLQGFPDGHTDGQVDSQRYRQLGNAVAVPVVEWIARRLVAVHEDPPRRSRSWVAGGVRYAPR